MIELLLSIIIIILLIGAYYLRKLPWYLSEYRDVQIMIWKELLVVTDRYRRAERFSSKAYDQAQADRQKIFEINNKLTEILKLNEKLLHTCQYTGADIHVITGLLKSINSK